MLPIPCLSMKYRQPSLTASIRSGGWLLASDAVPTEFLAWAQGVYPVGPMHKEERYTTR